MTYSHCNVTLGAYLRQVGMYTAQNYKQKQWSKLILFLGKNINLMDYCRSEKWAHKTNGQHCLQVLWSVWRQRLNSSSAIKAGRRREENMDWEQKFKTGVREEKKSFKTPIRNEKVLFYIILKWSGNRINVGQSKLWTFNLHRKMNALSCLLTRVKEISCKQT